MNLKSALVLGAPLTATTYDELARTLQQLAKQPRAIAVDFSNRLSPDFIWIGLGAPKRQTWIHQYKNRIYRGIVLAVEHIGAVREWLGKNA